MHFQRAPHQVPGSGQAPILEYNLPQSRCFESTGYVRLKVDDDCWKSSVYDPATDNFWDEVAEMSASEIHQRINDDILGVAGRPFIINGNHLHRINDLVKVRASIPNFANVAANEAAYTRQGTTLHNTGTLKSDVTAAKPGATLSSAATAATAAATTTTTICDVDVHEIVSQVQRGRRPVLRRDAIGNVVLAFIPRPKPLDIIPSLTLVLHYRTCSYLGNYGAGKVVKTFSLLPGEKTTISIRTYKHDETTALRSENVLDSFSENSAKELQSTVETQSTFDTSNQHSSTSGHESGGGGNLKIDVGIFSLGGGVSGSSSNSSTINSAISQHTQNLNSAISDQVNNSSRSRDINIDTETSTTSISGSEESTVREIQNINFSRVLNFVFRQLMLDHFTITYLYDVSIMFSNGYPESRKIIKLADLGTLLDEVLNPDNGTLCVSKTKAQIYSLLCGIYDYQGSEPADKKSIIEEVTESYVNCITDVTPDLESATWVRVKKNLSQTYTDPDSGIEYTVPGIITNISHYTLPTDSVIVDALLGQGEALDCYNMKLQDAATQKAQLDLDQQQQQIDVINDITDPIDKAVKYKKVFGDCCDVPQSGSCSCGGSGCGDCIELE